MRNPHALNGKKNKNVNGQIQMSYSFWEATAVLKNEETAHNCFKADEMGHR